MKKMLAVLLVVGLVVFGLIGCDTGGTGDLAPTISNAVVGGDCSEMVGTMFDFCILVDYLSANSPCEMAYLKADDLTIIPMPTFPPEKECTLLIAFPESPAPGTYDLWVVDEAGRESNHLEVTL